MTARSRRTTHSSAMPSPMLARRTSIWTASGTCNSTASAGARPRLLGIIFWESRLRKGGGATAEAGESDVQGDDRNGVGRGDGGQRDTGARRGRPRTARHGGGTNG